MQVRIVAVGAVRGVEELTYSVPPELERTIAPGHRVLAPLRSRKVTGVVLEAGENLCGAGAHRLKPILELLEPRPLFDRAHLRMMEFLANYYMVPLSDVYRSVIPAVARIESRIVYRLAHDPDALRRAAFSAMERKVVEALEKRAMDSRQLARLGAQRELSTAISALAAEGIVETVDSTRGRHRDNTPMLARIAESARCETLRGGKQRLVAETIAAAGGALALDDLEHSVPGAKLALRMLEKRGIVSLEPILPASRNGAAPVASSSPLKLSTEQKEALAAIAPAIEERKFAPFLLFGVTGSGKTEVYLHLAERALACGRSVIVMVPEIALADEIVRSFRARFGALAGIAHSAQNVAERWASWKSALSGEARIMIGPRSLVFAPIHDPGLIVVDEEHDPSYKNEEGIRYHARDLAVVLARMAGCPIVLGSATPSAESFANARRGRYRLLRLLKRAGDRAMASVEVVDLRGEMARVRTQAPQSEEPKRDVIPLSRALIEALRGNLAAGGQSMVFLNRRGYHNFLQCHLCGNVIACTNCSVSLTFHLRDRSLRCHYCGIRSSAPELCPECGGMGLQGQGFGTERLVSVLAEIVPDARIERMDSDTSGRRGAREAMLGALRAGEIDILVGTQMITKGFDFPGVTLAAVILADNSLNLPDFRSAERTFQLLTQVAGRAGRGEHAGRVIIQTYAPHHYSIRAAREQDYLRFIRRELELRRELSYPPFAKLAMVRIEGEDAPAVSRIAGAAADALGRAAAAYRRAATRDPIRVLGPAPAPIERIKKRYRWQVMVKSENLTELRTALAAMHSALAERALAAGVHLAIDIDPVQML